MPDVRVNVSGELKHSSWHYFDWFARLTCRCARCQWIMVDGDWYAAFREMAHCACAECLFVVWKKVFDCWNIGFCIVLEFFARFVPTYFVSSCQSLRCFLRERKRAVNIFFREKPPPIDEKEVRNEILDLERNWIVVMPLPEQKKNEIRNLFYFLSIFINVVMGGGIWREESGDVHVTLDHCKVSWILNNWRNWCAGVVMPSPEQKMNEFQNLFYFLFISINVLFCHPRRMAFATGTAWWIKVLHVEHCELFAKWKSACGAMAGTKFNF